MTRSPRIVAAVGGWLIATAAAAQVPGSPAEPDRAPETHGCLAAFRRAQNLRDERKLIAARRELLWCARDVCAEVVQRKCRAWLPEVVADTPSLVVLATGADGRDRFEARLSVDGDSVAERLDGKAIDLDPGPHTVVVEGDGQRTAERVVLAQGERNRVVRVRFPAPLQGAPPLPRARRISPLAYTGFSLAAATLIAGSVAGGVTLARAAKLKEQCASVEGCRQNDIDAGYRLADVATGMFVIAGVGVAAGVTGLLLPTREPRITALLRW